MKPGNHTLQVDVYLRDDGILQSNSVKVHVQKPDRKIDQTFLKTLKEEHLKRDYGLLLLQPTYMNGAFPWMTGKYSITGERRKKFLSLHESTEQSTYSPYVAFSLARHYVHLAKHKENQEREKMARKISSVAEQIDKKDMKKMNDIQEEIRTEHPELELDSAAFFDKIVQKMKASDQDFRADQRKLVDRIKKLKKLRIRYNKGFEKAGRQERRKAKKRFREALSRTENKMLKRLIRSAYREYFSKEDQPKRQGPEEGDRQDIDGYVISVRYHEEQEKTKLTISGKLVESWEEGESITKKEKTSIGQKVASIYKKINRTTPQKTEPVKMDVETNISSDKLLEILTIIEEHILSKNSGAKLHWVGNTKKDR